MPIKEKNVVYTVEISLILDGKYYPDSDIQIGMFKTKEEAMKIAQEIDVQSPELYECYVYTLDGDSHEIIDDIRIF